MYTLNSMKKGSFVLLFWCAVQVGYAQIHELGVFVGGSNTISDIGATRFVYANSSAVGAVYKWNLTTRYALRASFKTSKLKSYDYYSSDLSRFRRFLTVDNPIYEFSAGFEFNFFDFNLHDDDLEFTPYFFTGVNYFQYDLMTLNDLTQEVIKYDSDQTFAIPAVVGIKGNISSVFVVGIEAGIRYTFTDNIDGSNPIGEFENNDFLKHGALYNNDWYVFTGFTLSFTFGRLPCYCKEK